MKYKLLLFVAIFIGAPIGTMFVAVPQASAALCNYKNTFDANPKKVVNSTTLNFTATVQQVSVGCNGYRYSLQFLANDKVVASTTGFQAGSGDTSTKSYTHNLPANQLGSFKKGDTIALSLRIRDTQNSDATGIASGKVTVTVDEDIVAAVPPTNGLANTSSFNVGPVDYDKSFGQLDSLINAKSVPDWFATIVKLFFLGIAGWAVIFILVGSFKLMMSRGNTEAIANGKKTVTWAIIGLCVSLLSYSIVAIFQTALGI
jgi:hypothetical protein